jgi:hypothetical protein
VESSGATTPADVAGPARCGAVRVVVNFDIDVSSAKMKDVHIGQSATAVAVTCA